MKKAAVPTAGARRGRPRQSESERLEARERLLAAAATVYAQGGEAAFTVERVLAEGQISRPTFYRWFESREQVLEQVVEDANRRLVQAVLLELKATATPEDLLRRGIDAYLDWGRGQGAMITALYRDLHQPGTAAARARHRTLRQVVGMVRAIAQAGGTPPSSLFIEAMLNAIEHLGSRLFAIPQPSAITRREHREAMLQVLDAAVLQVRGAQNP